MANDIDKTSSHYKGEFSNIYEVNQKYPSGGVAGDYVEIDGWAHYWNADRGTWCVNEKRDEYWDELITNTSYHLNLLQATSYVGSVFDGYINSVGTIVSPYSSWQYRVFRVTGMGFWSFRYKGIISNVGNVANVAFFKDEIGVGDNLLAVYRDFTKDETFDKSYVIPQEADYLVLTCISDDWANVSFDFTSADFSYLNGKNILPNSNYLTQKNIYIKSDGTPTKMTSTWFITKINALGVVAVEFTGSWSYNGEVATIAFYKDKIAKDSLVSLISNQDLSGKTISVPEGTNIIVLTNTADKDGDFELLSATIFEEKIDTNTNRITELETADAKVYIPTETISLSQNGYYTTNGIFKESNNYLNTGLIDVEDGDTFDYDVSIYVSAGMILFNEDGTVADYIDKGTSESYYYLASGRYKVDKSQYPNAAKICFGTIKNNRGYVSKSTKQDIKSYIAPIEEKIDTNTNRITELETADAKVYIPTETISLSQNGYYTTNGIFKESNNYLNTGLIDVEDGDTFDYDVSIYVSAGMILFNEDGTVADYIDKGTSESYYYLASGRYKVDKSQYPNAAKICFGTIKNNRGTTFRVEKEAILDHLAPYENLIGIGSCRELEIAETKSGMYASVNAVYKTYSVYNCYLFDVEPNSKYHVITEFSGGGDNAIIYLINNIGSISIIQPDNNEKGSKYSGKVITRNDTVQIGISVLATTEIHSMYESVDQSGTGTIKDGALRNNKYAAMIENDEYLAKAYGDRCLNYRYAINSLYDFLNLTLTNSFVKPEKGSSVDISISDVSAIKANSFICIGNLQSYDIYEVTSINTDANSISASLINDGLSYYAIGDTVPTTISMTYGGKDEYSESIRVYLYEDVRSYEDDVLPPSSCYDNIHPQNEVYTLLGKIIADRIKSIAGAIPTRVCVYGDSWGQAGIYPKEIGDQLGCTMLNKSVAGDATMHVRKHFLFDFEAGTVSNDDFFVFQMGTNNLHRYGTASSDSLGQIMQDYKFHFNQDLRLITEKLNGNFLIVPGHAGCTTRKYKN